MRVGLGEAAEGQETCKGLGPFSPTGALNPREVEWMLSPELGAVAPT